MQVLTPSARINLFDSTRILQISIKRISVSSQEEYGHHLVTEIPQISLSNSATNYHKSALIIWTILTVPLLPMERWLSCCVRGPIIEVGWIDMVWSIPGVRTAPFGKENILAHYMAADWILKQQQKYEYTHCGRHYVWLVMYPGRIVYLSEWHRHTNKPRQLHS